MCGRRWWERDGVTLGRPAPAPLISHDDEIQVAPDVVDLSGDDMVAGNNLSRRPIDIHSALSRQQPAAHHSRSHPELWVRPSR